MSYSIDSLVRALSAVDVYAVVEQGESLDPSNYSVVYGSAHEITILSSDYTSTKAALVGLCFTYDCLDDAVEQNPSIDMTMNEFTGAA